MFDSQICLRRLLLLLLFAASSCAFANGPSINKIAARINATRYDRVVIAVGDLVELRFAYHEDWNQEAMVQPDGVLSLKGIEGGTPAAGFTPDQLQGRLKNAYKAVWDDADLTIGVKERAARTVTMMGEVNDAGAIVIGPENHLTLVEAIGRAGSFNIRSAYLGSLLLIRWNPDEQKQMSWRIDARVEHWGGEEPILLQPFDVVYIPNTPVYGVGIWVDNWIRRMIPLPFFQIN